jgi:hypothetical protein
LRRHCDRLAESDCEALDHLCELLESHWREARDTDDEEGRFAIGFKVSVNAVRVRRRERIGGLLNYYHREAA